MNAGVAFQIVDDVLDLVGTQREIGKTLGRDLDLGKPTLPIIHALASGSASARRELSRLLRNGRAASGVNVERLLDETESVQYALLKAGRYVTSAQQQISQLSSSPARDSLLAMSDFIVRRRN
jgi:octaprenyl-diphosphate synthase